MNDEMKMRLRMMAGTAPMRPATRLLRRVDRSGDDASGAVALGPVGVADCGRPQPWPPAPGDRLSLCSCDRGPSMIPPKASSCRPEIGPLRLPSAAAATPGQVHAPAVMISARAARADWFRQWPRRRRRRRRCGTELLHANALAE